MRSYSSEPNMARHCRAIKSTPAIRRRKVSPWRVASSSTTNLGRKRAVSAAAARSPSELESFDGYSHFRQINAGLAFV